MTNILYGDGWGQNDLRQKGSCGACSRTRFLIPHFNLLPHLLSATLVTMPPPSMKEFNIKDTGVKIDVAAIEWPANATALAHEDDALVCRTTDPDESKEGAETSELRIGCERGQVIGDVGNIVLPEGMQTVDFSNCTGLTGDIAEFNLPVSMKTVNFAGCEGLAVPPG